MRKLIITATILVPTAAFAGGYLIPSMNPRDLALAGNAVADEAGPEATFLNTADLASQEGLAIGVAGAPIARNHTDWSDPTLGNATASNNSTVPTLAVSYGEKLPFDQAWGIGLSFGVPAGGNLPWQDSAGQPNWAGQEAIRSVNTQVFGFGGGAAFQLLPYFRFGVNYIRYQATEELHQALNYLDHVGDAGIGLAGGGNSIGVSTEILPPMLPLRIGITYQHGSTIGFTGHVHFTDVPPAFQPMLHDQPISEDFLIPDTVAAGAAYEIQPGLKIMGSYSFEHWKDYKNDKFVGDGGFSTTVTRNYNNAHNVGVAGEWHHTPFVPQLSLRAGVARGFSDQPTDTVSPSLTDGSRWSLSVGAGYDLMPNLRLDAGFEHVLFDSVTATGMDAFPGTYKTSLDFLSVGVTWRTQLRPSPVK
ncbi:MAG TPA: outer membrane protein transport protein [Kofleriaceae bacterium]|nr:outer membrane protein transport protein [Kofleriaceae bacterium]